MVADRKVEALRLVDLKNNEVGSVRIIQGKPVFEGQAEDLSSNIGVNPAEDANEWLRCYAGRCRGPYVRAMPVWASVNADTTAAAAPA